MRVFTLEQHKARLAASRRWREQNPEAMKKLKRAAYYRAHPKRRPPKDLGAPTRAKKNWKIRNPDAVYIERAARRAKELNATPTWANKFFIAEIYSFCRFKTKVTGLRYHVDHVIPLRGFAVSGLHVHQNLQLLPASANLSKGNRMPTEYAT